MKVLGDGFTIFPKFVMLQEFPVVECVSLTVGVVNSAKNPYLGHIQGHGGTKKGRAKVFPIKVRKKDFHLNCS